MATALIFFDFLQGDINLGEWEVYLFDLNPLWEDELKARCASYSDLAVCEVILAGAWNTTKSIGY